MKRFHDDVLEKLLKLCLKCYFLLLMKRQLRYNG